jgi:cardiolipin synthase
MTAGEAWTRELLADLRASGFRPTGWRSFLSRSFARSAEMRALRRREHRQLVLLATLGTAAWAAVAAGGQPWLALAGAAWLVLLLLLVDWHLGMLEDETGRRLAGLGIPNLLGIGRGALVPALLATPAPLVLTLLLAAGASDVLDGPLARARGQESRLGRFLDGGVDACVLGAVAVAAARLGLLPWWSAGLVLGRHLAQWSALALAYFLGVQTARESIVNSRTAGLVIFGGLVLALIHVPLAGEVVAAGALAAIAALVLTIARTLRLEVAPA